MASPSPSSIHSSGTNGCASNYMTPDAHLTKSIFTDTSLAAPIVEPLVPAGVRSGVSSPGRPLTGASSGMQTQRRGSDQRGFSRSSHGYQPGCSPVMPRPELFAHFNATEMRLGNGASSHFLLNIVDTQSSQCH
jgi:hypothetical protein